MNLLNEDSAHLSEYIYVNERTVQSAGVGALVTSDTSNYVNSN
jgi:hypothetical protein